MIQPLSGRSNPTTHQSLPAEPDGPSPRLAQFLEDWLDEVVRRSVRPKTFVSYRSIVRIHLIPALGAIPIADLRPRDVQAFLTTRPRLAWRPARWPTSATSCARRLAMPNG